MGFFRRGRGWGRENPLFFIAEDPHHMAKLPNAPRKQRTREHIIADLSVHHVEGFILEEGHTVQTVERDYGYDLLLFTYDEYGYVEPGLLFIQLKSAERLQAVEFSLCFRSGCS